MVENKQQTWPLVSVVIPAFNAGRWIEETLVTASRQTYTHLEILVVDDGSTDTTTAVVSRIADQDPRITLICQENGGVGRARNRGLAAARGELIAFLDADDLWHPAKILKQVNCFLRHREAGRPVGMVYCWSQNIDEKSHVTRTHIPRTPREGQVFHHLLSENFLSNGSTSLISREALKQTGGYLEKREAGGCADWALYLRVAHSFHLYAVDECLVGYRRMESSMSTDYQKMLVAHHHLIEDLKSYMPAVPAYLVRNSRSGILLWLGTDTNVFSPKFKDLLLQLLRNDPFFMLKGSTPRMLALTAITRSLRIIRRLGIRFQSMESVHYLSPENIPTFEDNRATCEG